MASPEKRLVSRREDLLSAASMLVVFILISLVSSLEKALAFSTLFGVFLTIIQTKGRGERSLQFWIAIAILAAIHVAVLSFIYIPPLRFGLMILPFALVDGFAIWGIVNWVDRHFPRPVDRREP